MDMYPRISHGEYFKVGDSHREVLIKTMFESQTMDMEILNQLHEWIYGGWTESRVKHFNEKRQLTPKAQ